MSKTTHGGGPSGITSILMTDHLTLCWESLVPRTISLKSFTLNAVFQTCDTWSHEEIKLGLPCKRNETLLCNQLVRVRDGCVKGLHIANVIRFQWARLRFYTSGQLSFHIQGWNVLNELHDCLCSEMLHRNPGYVQ